jgi:hypothetical protein
MKGIARPKAVGLGIVFALGLLFTLLLVSVAFDWVEVTSDGEQSSEMLAAPNAEGSAPAAGQDDSSPWPFQGFPLGQYASFEEAEQIAGYHIPRPSAEYPVAFGQTSLRWFPQFDRPLSTTEYTYPPLAPTSIGVGVLPSYFYPHGDEGATEGKQTVMGSKSGWLKELDYSFTFTYGCGEVDGYNLWCSVSSPKEVAREAFEHFVSTLE